MPSLFRVAALLVLALPSTLPRLLAEGGSLLPPAALMESVQPKDLRAHAELLASTELGGRHTISPSSAVAARYLASRLRSYGFKGGGDGGEFLQRFTLLDSQDLQGTATLSLPRETEPAVFDTESDLYLFPDGPAAKLEAEAVFAGHGITAPDGSHDDYRQLDVKGKVVVVVPGAPGGGSGQPWASPKSITAENKARIAAERGAVALLVLGESQRESTKTGTARTGDVGTLVLADSADARRSIPAVRLSLRASEALLAGTGLKAKALVSGSALPPARGLGRRVVLETTQPAGRFTAANVVGILEGSDSRLKQEYVLFSAHYDHLRTRDGKVFTGADDDASGTSAILEIAEAVALGPRPARSVLVIFHTGEEEGLLGSAYFVRHPAVPLNNIVAALNIDMIGRSRPEDEIDNRNEELSDAQTVYLIGSDKLSSELHRLSEEVNQQTERLSLDYRYNRDDHPERLYYRSDHWNYAKRGIPVIFYFTGLHIDYHQPTDTVDKLDFEKMSRITRLVLATGWRLANLDHRVRLLQPADGKASGR